MDRLIDGQPNDSQQWDTLGGGGMSQKKKKKTHVHVKHCGDYWGQGVQGD